MEDQLRHLPGYIGNSPQNNPERQAIGTPRTWEEMRKDLMTIDQLEKELLDWIVATYHHAESRALKGLSPMAALETHVKNGWTAREVRDERALDLLLMERLERGGRPVVVKRGGKIQAFGSKWEPRFFEAPELIELTGQEVHALYDPDSIGQLYIYKDSRFVCVAKNSELLNFGAKKVDLERKWEIERHQTRRLRERREELLTAARYGGDALRQSIAERNYKDVEAEEQRKIAAGAQAGAVTVLLPKYQQAARKLAAVPVVKRERPVPVVDEDPLESIEEISLPVKKPEWLVDDELKSSDELFPIERNQWLESDENE
jgi:hypothetical protein